MKPNETLGNRGDESLGGNKGSLATQELLQDWLEHVHEGTQQRAMIAALKSETDAMFRLLEFEDMFAKPSQWIVGGDGWAWYRLFWYRPRAGNRRDEYLRYGQRTLRKYRN